MKVANESMGLDFATALISHLDNTTKSTLIPMISDNCSNDFRHTFQRIPTPVTTFYRHLFQWFPTLVPTISGTYSKENRRGCGCTRVQIPWKSLYERLWSLIGNSSSWTNVAGAEIIWYALFSRGMHIAKNALKALWHKDYQKIGWSNGKESIRVFNPEYFYHSVKIIWKMRPVHGGSTCAPFWQTEWANNPFTFICCKWSRFTMNEMPVGHRGRIACVGVNE